MLKTLDVSPMLYADGYVDLDSQPAWATISRIVVSRRLRPVISEREISRNDMVKSFASHFRESTLIMRVYLQLFPDHYTRGLD